jgi:hypothetical protein
MMFFKKNETDHSVVMGGIQVKPFAVKQSI